VKDADSPCVISYFFPIFFRCACKIYVDGEVDGVIVGIGVVVVVDDGVGDGVCDVVGDVVCRGKACLAPTVSRYHNITVSRYHHIVMYCNAHSGFIRAFITANFLLLTYRLY
jgi:hypothetical protein